MNEIVQVYSSIHMHYWSCDILLGINGEHFYSFLSEQKLSLSKFDNTLQRLYKAGA